MIELIRFYRFMTWHTEFDSPEQNYWVDQIMDIPLSEWEIKE